MTAGIELNINLHYFHLNKLAHCLPDSFSLLLSSVLEMLFGLRTTDWRVCLISIMTRMKMLKKMR